MVKRFLGFRNDREISERAPRPRMLTATDGRDILWNDPAGWEVQQPWLWWIDPPNGSEPVFGNPPPGANGNYRYVSIPAVTRCTTIICDTIAGLPWQVYKGWDRQATPQWISDPQNLRQDGRIAANGVDEVRLSAVEFWTEFIVSALWFGDGYVYVPTRNVDGAPSGNLWNLNPSKVTIEAGRYWIDGLDEPLPPGAIIHLRGSPPYVDGHGQGVMSRHGLDLALAAEVRAYAAGQYHSGIPYGYLKSTQPRMDSAQAQTLKEKWLEQHGGTQRGIAVLNAATEFVPLAISPIDAQLTQAREWSLRDIAMAFGVPSYMLGIPGDSATYANVESRMIELRMFTLLPWIRRIESTLDAQFPRGTELKVQSAGLERADTMTRANAYKVFLDAGVYTRDEVRAFENLPPLGSEADDSIPTVDEVPADSTDSNVVPMQQANG